MAHFVNSSYCRNRCFDRGLCYVLGNNYHCICHQPSAYDDCRDNTTTTATTTTIFHEKQPSTISQIKVVCGVVVVVLLGLALITLYGLHQMDSTSRNGTGVEQAGREEAPSFRATFRSSAPPLEE
ncbi:unnamed protein product [Cylicocyclus nassatus]|uniref:EGF-like domain-containing protein n=1 Tax=Cylicocyclus nassatus TaxID=53992 RepID=A0AA36GXC2_CYLNA|nr:unnamed protein product [Cylicocyclus nassatus]